MHKRRAVRVIAAGGLLSILLASLQAGPALARQSRASRTAAPSPSPTSTAAAAQSLPTSSALAAPAPARPRVFAYYYLWWSRSHWTERLGPNYPVTASPLPLPATLDVTGCNPASLYPGNSLTDAPARLYSQDDPGFIEADVREAAAAGLAGFAVNWIGTGSASQTATSSPYSKRLQAMVDAVHQVNAEGIRFKLWLSYKASASVLTVSAIENDLAYFTRVYGADPAFDRAQSSRPTVIWNGSRKYPVAILDQVGRTHRAKLRILGDETTWSPQRARYLDGNAYYWSSQNPWANPGSFTQLRSLAASVKASGTNPDGSVKAWIAPLAPGYDKQLAGGTVCTPRRRGETLRALYAGNRTTRPEAWGLISWNEITEGTYVDPMTRFGRQDLDVLASIIATAS